MPATLHQRIPAGAKVLSPTGDLGIEDVVSQRESLAKAFRSRKVAISGDARFLFKWLTILDGVVERLVMVPQTADASLVHHIKSAGEVEALISQSRPTHNCWQGCELFLEAEQHDKVDFPAPELDGSGRISQWVLATSGTTRTPKLVAHSLESLSRTMKIDARFGDYRWGLMYDPARFAGLQVLLQAMLNGATLLAPPLDLSLAQQLKWLAELGCDAMSATPTLWRKMLMTPGFDRLSLRQITLGGEIADATILTALTHQFPTARITHVYASTEAGVGFAVHDGRPGFPAAWLTTGVRELQMRLGADNCLWVSPKRVEQRYIGSDEELMRSDGWIDTGDVLKIENDRAIFCGRLNGSINIGGNKVYPEEIESTVLEVDGVGTALARGKASSVMGNLVEVLIVPIDGASDDLVARVKAHCRSKLERYKVPAFVRLVKQLDTSATGKILRTP